jgi:hypothetical protein
LFIVICHIQCMPSYDMVVYFVCQKTSGNTYGTIQNGQSRDTSTQDGDKQKHNIIYVL